MQDTTLFTLTNARFVFASAPDSAVTQLRNGLGPEPRNRRGERIGEVQQSIGDYAAYGSLEWTPVAPFTITARLALCIQHPVRMHRSIPSVNLRWKIEQGLHLARVLCTRVQSSFVEGTLFLLRGCEP